MKRSKRLPLATAAILVVAIGLLTSSASATSLCKENANPCKAPYPIKETVLAGLEAGSKVAYEMTDSMGFKVLEGVCQESSLSWSTTENKGANKVLLGTMTALLFGKCTKEPTSCERAKAENLPYGVELVPSVMGVGTAVLVNGAAIRKLKFEGCGVFSFNCVYEGGTTGFELQGGSPARIVLEFKMNAEGSNMACGAKLKLLTPYTVAAPKPLWVEGEP
jgi:hypothetical protein